MTGRENLIEELRSRGATKAQLNSKLIPLMLEILSESDGEYLRIYELEQEIASKERNLQALQANIQIAKHKLEDFRKLTQAEIEKLKLARNDFEEDMKTFTQSLAECETAEGRDTIRTAQLYIESVDISTAYDNTAYIIGLASILSNGNVGAMQTLQKINKKLPLSAIDIRI